MATELQVPHVGESIYEVTIGEWLKGEGDYVKQDEPIVALETDKASLDVPAPTSGKLVKLLKQEGDSASVGEAIAMIEAGEAPASSESSAGSGSGGAAPAQESAPAAEPGRAETERNVNSDEEPRVMPAARRLLERHALRPQDITPTGPGQRLLKEDVMRHLEQVNAPAPPAQQQQQQQRPAPRPSAQLGEREEVVPMSPLRRRIAERLVHSQQTTASLTTFNEVDLGEVFELRSQFKESFQERHGVKLGFMSFFVKATIEALKEFPQVNSEIRDTDVIFKHYRNIGVAVGGGKGLLVPVIRDADRLSFAEIELTIRDFAIRAKKGKIRPDELQGGTFTISNGGVYGSMLSTPIINPPQVAILGMHNIEERPVVKNGEIVIRPMMYVALSYDHRIIDGRESVTFLKRIKDCLENPARMLLEV